MDSIENHMDDENWGYWGYPKKRKRPNIGFNDETVEFEVLYRILKYSPS